MKGFSLIEMLVAATIFALAVGSISSLFVMSLGGQRNILAQQNVADNIRFSLEYMARQIRMAQRDNVAGDCTGTSRMTYDDTSIASGIIFVDYRGNCVVYKKNGTKIEAQIGAAAPFDLTSNDVKINTLDFSSRGERVGDSEQPRVTIFIEAEDTSESSVKIRLQTTVSSRNLDVP